MGDRLLPIIVALIKLPAAAVAHAGLLRRVKHDMAQRATLFASPPPGQSFDDDILRHLNQQYTVQVKPHRFENLVQALGLRNRAREAVEEKTALAIFLLQAFGD